MLRRGALVLAYVLAAIVLSVAMVAIHVDTPLGRRAIREVTNIVLADTFRGHLEIGEVRRANLFGADGVEVVGIALRDPQGRWIATGGELKGGPLTALWNGLRHRGAMPTARLHLRTFSLVPGSQGVPSVADAFLLRRPPPRSAGPGRPGAPFTFPALDLSVDRFENSFGGIDLVAREVNAHGRTVTEPITLQIGPATTNLTGPRIPALHVRGSFDWRSHFVQTAIGAQDHGAMDLVLDLTGEQLACHFELHRQDTDTRILTTGCRASAGVIDALAQQTIGVDARVDSFEARQHGAGPWAITGRGAVQGEPFEASVEVASPEEITGDLSVHGLDLSRIRGSLPVSSMTGSVHIERHGDRVVADTDRLNATLAGVRIPGAHARAHLVGRRLILDGLDSSEAGVSAHGELDLDHPDREGWVEAHVQTHEAGDLPGVDNRVRGELTADVRAEMHDGSLTARFDAHGRRIHAQGVAAGAAHARGVLRMPATGDPDVVADVDFQGLQTGNVGPINGRATVSGDPTRHVRGHIHARGDSISLIPRPRGRNARPATSAPTPPAETSIDGDYVADIDRDAVRVNVPRSHVVLRGAVGEVEAHLRIPRGHGTLAGRVDIHAQNAGEAHLDVQGSNVRGSFAGFSLAWLNQALGTELPITGTIEGDLEALTDRVAGAHGHVRWTNGQLPVLGPFDLSVDVDHREAGSVYTAQLEFGENRARLPVGSRPNIHAVIRAEPPRDPADVRGWLRGIENADVDAANISAGMVDALLPRGAELRGAAHAHLTARRDESGRLATVLGFEIRHILAGFNASELLWSPLRGMTNGAATPLVQEFRVRGALCGQIGDGELDAVPVQTDTVVAREVGEPEVPAPTECSEAATMTQERWVRAFGGLQGPWLAAAKTSVAELQAARAHDVALTSFVPSPAARDLLRAATADLGLHVGPIRGDAEHWPFTREAGLIAAPLARPALPGTAEADVRVQGTLFSPRLGGEVTLDTSGLEQLVSRDRLHAHAVATLQSRTAGAWILDDVDLGADADAQLTAVTPGHENEAAGSAQAHVRANGPLGAAIAGDGLRALDYERFQVETSEFQLGRLRWSHVNNVDGLLSLRVRATLDPQTPISADATITQLHVRAQHHMSATLNAYARKNEDQWEIQTCGTVLGLAPDATSQRPPPACNPDEESTSAPPRGLHATVTLPLRGDLLAFVPDATQVILSAAFDAFEIETVSPLLEVSPIVRVAGTLSGHGAWTARAPRNVDGEVHIRNGFVDLERVGLPARQIALDITSEGHRADISHLGFSLGSGTVDGTGHVDFAGTGTDVARLTLDARTQRLPATQEGNVFGYISSHIGYDGRFRTDGANGTLTIENASVEVPDETARDLQELDAHAGVFVIGQTRLGHGGPSRTYPIDITYSTQNPVWARRTDFAVAIRSDGRIHWDNAGLQVVGTVEQAVQQSWFEVFGKRFYFDHINVQFDGSLSFNPILDVAAHFDSPTAGRINVFVTDHWQAMQITFTAEQYPAASQSEILALLVLGRRQSSGQADQSQIAAEAQSAAASLLAGLAFGVGSTIVRRQFEFLPTIIAEPGTSADNIGRYGLGVTTLNGRLYLEGAYESVPSGLGSPGQQEFRTLGEFTLSNHVSVSTAAAVGSSVRWGVDLYFTP